MHYLANYNGGNMSQRIKRNFTSLQALAKASNAIKSDMISTASKDLILSLVECASNIIKGNVRLTPAQFRRLRRYRVELERLVKPRTSQRDRKTILQKGGFLGALVRPLLELLLGPRR